MIEAMAAGALMGWLAGELLTGRHRQKVRIGIAILLALMALLLPISGAK